MTVYRLEPGERTTNVHIPKNADLELIDYLVDMLLGLSDEQKKSLCLDLMAELTRKELQDIDDIFEEEI